MHTHNSLLKQKIQWAKDNSSICFLPYSKIDIRLPFIQNQNKVRLSCCCNLQPPIIVDQFKKDPFVEIKKNMSRGYLPNECNICINEESTGGISERVRDIVSKSLDELESFKTNKEIKSFEISIFVSNICNLACRSCETNSSSTFSKITLNNESNFLSVDITSIEFYWNLITDIIRDKVQENNIVYIHFMGGEPLLQKGNYKIIEWIIENNLQDKIIIRLTTSINVPVKKDLSIKLNQFKLVEFILSIDGVYENYHYIRWPANFNKTIQNLNDIVNFSKESKNSFRFFLSPVISLNNVFYLNDFLDFWHEWQNKTQVNLWLIITNLLPRTEHLDFQALPLIYRPFLTTFLEEILNHEIFTRYNEETLQLENFINSAIYEIKNYKEDLNLWNSFLEHTAEFDVRTNTDFKYYNKKLYDILLDADKILFESKVKKVDKFKKFIA